MSDYIEQQDNNTLVFNKLSMYKDSVDGKHSDKLSWAIKKGYPRITVFKNDGDTSDIIIAPMSHAILFSLFSMMEDLLKSDAVDTSFHMECLNIEWIDDKKTDNVVPQAEIHCGRYKNGLYWIGLQSSKVGLVTFDFNLSKWHKMYDNNGNERSMSETSQIFFQGYLMLLKKALGDISSNDVSDTRKEYVSKQNKKKEEVASTLKDFKV